MGSKKNKVFKIKYEGKYYIAKRYIRESIDGLNRECVVLKECEKKGLCVPEVVDIAGNILILEYIPGINCKKLFDSKDDGIKTVLSGIADWLSQFHSSFDFRERRGDCILENFIIHDSVIYGIDFEECVNGDYLRDIGDICTSILRMKPSFTEDKFFLVEYFVGEYFTHSSRDRVDITDGLVESLLHYSRYGSQGEMMKRWAERIKKDGLDNISPN